MSKFTPSDAYIIMGHGQENRKFITIPDDCMVVVKYRPGEIANSFYFFPFLNIIGDPKNAEIYRDPEIHIKTLANQIGDVAIFKPGDKCPNFIYSFKFTADNILRDKTANKWGLYSIPLASPIEEVDNEGEYKLKEWIPEIYGGNILINGTDVANDMIEVFKNEDKKTNVTINNAFEGTFDKRKLNAWEKNKRYTFTQQDLFDIDEQGKARRPGVYYNFVCREVSSVGYGLGFGMEGTNIVNNSTIHSLRHIKNPIIRHLLTRRIAEAETKRKHVVRHSNKFNPKGGNRRTRHRIHSKSESGYLLSIRSSRLL